MEERIIDDPRKIKVTKNAVGGIKDATDGIAPEAEEGKETEELDVAFPEEYDEDLVGLAPSQLQEALKKREKEAEAAREQCEKHLAEGERLLQRGDFAGAEAFFVQAAVYDPDCARAKEGIWLSRTRNFKEIEPLYVLENAKEIADSDEKTQAFVKKNAGERLEADRAAYLSEEKPLKERFETAQKTRSEKFRENRKYYLIRFTIFLTITVLLGIATGVSASFLYRTDTMTPIYFIIAFGVLTAIALTVALIYLRRTLQAVRLEVENKKLSSTEDGARLSELRSRLLCISLILGEKED